jgi:hypothetical protein
MHRCLRGDGDTNEIGIDNELGRNGAGQFYGISNGK